MVVARQTRASLEPPPNPGSARGSRAVLGGPPKTSLTLIHQLSSGSAGRWPAVFGGLPRGTALRGSPNTSFTFFVFSKRCELEWIDEMIGGAPDPADPLPGAFHELGAPSTVSASSRTVPATRRGGARRSDRAVHGPNACESRKKAPHEYLDFA